MSRENNVVHILRNFGTSLAVLLLAACVAIPTAQFEAYLNNFQSAKSAAQDVYLQAANVAEANAIGEDSDRDIQARIRDLEGDRAGLAMRLAALDLIDRYNTMLVAFAKGVDPDDIAGDITGLKQGLESFKIREVTRFLGSASPYIGIISEGLVLMQEAINKEKFADALMAGQKPIDGIIDLLIADSGTLEKLAVNQVKREQDAVLAVITSAGRQFGRSLSAYQASAETNALLAEHNEYRRSLRRTSVGGIPHAPAAAPPTPDTIAALGALNLVVKQQAGEYASLEAQTQTVAEVYAAYRQVLAGFKDSFADLRTATEESRLLATVATADRVLTLRRAFLKLRKGL